MVAKGYRRVDRDQQFLMPESMRNWLPASDPLWLVIEVVSGLDTARLHAKRRIGGAGRAGYDPDMLLTLLIWAWAQGVRSSRVIERLCHRDVAFRIVCAGDAPDHVTISRFRAGLLAADEGSNGAADGDQPGVVEELFAQVLVLCARLGMGRVGVVALDGVKIASNASLSANRTEAGLVKAAAAQGEADAAKKARALARAAAAEHAATDAAEDALFGVGVRGDEVPEELVDPSSRAARIAQALADLAQVNSERAEAVQAAESRRQERAQARQERRNAQLQAYLGQRDERGTAPVGKPPKEIRVEVLTCNLAEARAVQQAKIDRYNAGIRYGGAPAPVDKASGVKRVKAALDRALADEAAERELQATAAMAVPTAQTATASKGEPNPKSEPQRNITDPQSRMMPVRGGGWIQGFNCQAVTSSDGLIIATSVGNNPNDATAFTTTMGKAVTAVAVIDAHRPATTADTNNTGIGVLLADAGYLSTDNLTAAGPDRLIAVGKSCDLAAAARDQPAEGPPPDDLSAIEAMAHRLRTPQGHELYKQRSHIAETPFGHAKHNLGFRRFTGCGLRRATAEFSFHALVHNLSKAIGTGTLAPAPNYR